VSAVHHFVPTYEPGAVGGHIAELQRLCHDLGWDSEVYTEHRRFPGREAHDFRTYARRARPGDVLVYHVAIGSGVADFVAGRGETLVVDHHNITPASYFEPWDPPVAHGVAWGRRQLVDLVARTRLGLADSAFNRAELDELGYRPTGVAPILFDPADLGGDVEDAEVERLGAEGTVWLFVSRFVPNKCQHDLVKAFAVYRRVYDAKAVLRLVGRSPSGPYADAVRALVAELGLDGAVELVGGVGAATLGAHYRAADVYVTVSRHEGFSMTPLEAMHHGVPVVAFAGGAVPETLGGAGLCLDTSAPGTVAAAVGRVVADPALRAGLVAAGHARLAEFSLEASRRVMAGHLRPLVEAEAR
jgi:glycosyltransferase involved in cell wall biosynthesis